MITIKNVFFLGLSATLLKVSCFAQQAENAVVSNDSIKIVKLTNDVLIKPVFSSSDSNRNNLNYNEEFALNVKGQTKDTMFYKFQKSDETLPYNDLSLSKKHKVPLTNILQKNNFSKLDLHLSSQENEPFFKNRRNLYSSMWAFASLNYIYADLTGLMDKNILLQYQNGVVNGTKITANFLAGAAGFMQIPLANVFLPQIIKNEKTLRWVQIASGTLMTLVQAGTLFVGKPTPHYAVYSAFEIAATSFITIDAIRWKAKSNKKKLITN